MALNVNSTKTSNNISQIFSTMHSKSINTVNIVNTTSFSNIMNFTTNLQNNNIPTKSNSINKNNSVSKGNSVSKNDYQKDTAVSNNKLNSKNNKVNDTSQTKNKDVQKISDNDNDVIDNDVIDKVKDVVEKIKETLKEKLDVSDEDVEKVLEVLGLTVIDLLNQNNLKDVFLNLQGKDTMDLLVDENLVNDLNDLLGNMEDLKFNSKISDDMINQVANQIDKTKVEQTNISKEDTLITKEEFIVDENVNMSENLNNNVVDEKSNNEHKDNHIQTDMENNTEETTNIKVEVFKEESSFNQNQGQNQEQNEQLDFTNQILNQISQAIDNTTNNVDDKSTDIRANIVEQIVDKIKVNIKTDVSSMEFNLNPEHLGKVHLQVASKDGVITAHFTAETQIAKEAIEGQIQQLKDALNEQGLKIEAVEVSVGQYDLNGNFSQDTNSNEQSMKKGSKKKLNLNLSDLNNIGEEEIELTEEEEITIDMMKRNGSNINFQA